MSGRPDCKIELTTDSFHIFLRCECGRLSVRDVTGVDSALVKFYWREHTDEMRKLAGTY